MRTQDEVRRELEHLSGLLNIKLESLKKLVERNKNETTSSREKLGDKEQESYEKSACSYGELRKANGQLDKIMSNARLAGLMDGRVQALAWVLGGTDDLYKDY